MPLASGPDMFTNYLLHKRAPHGIDNDAVNAFYQKRFLSPAHYTEEYKDKNLREILPALMAILFSSYIHQSKTLIVRKHASPSDEVLLGSDRALREYNIGNLRETSCFGRTRNISLRHLMPCYEFFQIVLQLDAYAKSPNSNCDDYRIARTINRLMSLDSKARELTVNPLPFDHNRIHRSYEALLINRTKRTICIAGLVAVGVALFACIAAVAAAMPPLGLVVASAVVAALSLSCAAGFTTSALVNFHYNHRSAKQLNAGEFSPPTQEGNGGFFSQRRANRYQKKLCAMNEVEEPLILMP